MERAPRESRRSFNAKEMSVAALCQKAAFLRQWGLALNPRTLHAGAALSSADIVAVLFYYTLRLNPSDPEWTERDYFINSRGHAVEPIYVALADLGFFPWDELKRVEDFGSPLHGLTAVTTPGIEFSCGALGHGLSLAVGTALGLRARGRPGRVFVVCGDGECQEGAVWEAALAAAHHRVDNLTLIVDRNGYQSDNRGTEAVMALEPLDQKFASFGFAVRRLDGHDISSLQEAFDSTPFERGRPSAVIADTVKGKGASSLESAHIHCGRFGRDLEPEILFGCLSELGSDVLPPALERLAHDTVLKARSEVPLGRGGLPLQELLLQHAARDPRICYVGVDTMEKEFQRRFPARAFDVGIAEQNELTLATGLAKAGMIPIVQGWSPFTPLRNFEQLRTSLARHQANVKIVSTALGLVNCSHGVTHHDMESVALYRLIPGLTVLAPFDVPQFEEAFEWAVRHEGPVVILAQPDIYAPGSDDAELPPNPNRGPFEVGRAQWWSRGEEAALLSFGPALRYSWLAAERLKREGVSVSVLDMCSLKPLDEPAVLEAARSSRVLISVEEQSIVGGLGSAVAEILSEAGVATRFRRIGIPDQFVEQLGNWTETRRGVQLTSSRITRTVRQLLER